MIGWPPTNHYVCEGPFGKHILGAIDSEDEAIDEVQTLVDNGVFDPPKPQWVKILEPDFVSEFNPMTDQL